MCVSVCASVCVAPSNHIIPSYVVHTDSICAQFAILHKLNGTPGADGNTSAFRLLRPGLAWPVLSCPVHSLLLFHILPVLLLLLLLLLLLFVPVNFSLLIIFNVSGSRKHKSQLLNSYTGGAEGERRESGEGVAGWQDRRMPGWQDNRHDRSNVRKQKSAIRNRKASENAYIFGVWSLLVLSVLLVLLVLSPYESHHHKYLPHTVGIYHCC